MMFNVVAVETTVDVSDVPEVTVTRRWRRTLTLTPMQVTFTRDDTGTVIAADVIGSDAADFTHRVEYAMDDDTPDWLTDLAGMVARP